MGTDKMDEMEGSTVVDKLNDHLQQKKKRILYNAQIALYYNELLIEQCNSWLSAEEGNRIMEERIIARNRKKTLH